MPEPSVCKICRSVGTKLFLKGERCFSPKCAITRRKYRPGLHGMARRRLSEYGMQLNEKQKAKAIYGMRERQFRNLFEKAAKSKANTGDKLLELLERRLDNVVFRMGLAPSRALARQLVGHGHFLVNDRAVDIPSFLVREGDVISVKATKKKKNYFQELMKNYKGANLPSWLKVEPAMLTGRIVALPEVIEREIDTKAIIELYSK